MSSSAEHMSRHPVASFVVRMRREITELKDTPVWSMNDDETRQTLTELTRLVAQATCLELKVAAQADRNNVGDASGATSAGVWWANQTRMTQAEAHRKVKLAKALERHEPVGDALAAGNVLVDQARVIADAVDALPEDIDPDIRTQARDHLLSQAQHFDAKALRIQGRRILDVVAPEVGEAEEAKRLAAEERRAEQAARLSMHDDGHGQTHGRFTLPTGDADTLRKALQALASPKAGGHGLSPHGMGLAFLEYIRRYPADRLPYAGGVSATVVVMMDYDTLMGGLKEAAWADDVADRVTKTAGTYGVKALSTGGIDVPSVVEAVVIKPVEPVRVLDLLINRKPLTGNEFEYLRQTVRTSNAAAVADNAVKPTSVYTFEDETDRARVFAHLSEPIPIRFLEDHDEVRNVLSAQMAEDVMLAVESSVLIGDGLGENFTGIASTVGVQTQAWSTDRLTTLRKARTKLTVSGETPTAWILNHAHLETLDLTVDGNLNFMGGIDDKIFGNLPKVGSSVVPAGTAYLGDWNQARLYVRDGGRLDADVSGALFDANQAKLRYEGRFGFACLRPSAFVSIDLIA